MQVFCLFRFLIDWHLIDWHLIDWHMIDWAFSVPE